jgi:hypothetical protein
MSEVDSDSDGAAYLLDSKMTFGMTPEGIDSNSEVGHSS